MVFLQKKKETMWLLGNSINDLNEIVLNVGLRRFVGAQLADWIYKKNVTSYEQMTNIGPKISGLISGAGYEIGGFEPSKELKAIDGTRKLLFQTLGGGLIESVYIPDGDRATLCVSSQSGCKMGCKFCMTGASGFGCNLTSGEIIGQILRCGNAEKLTNVVMMGMGEPLDNIDEVLKSIEIMTSPWGLAWSPTRITLSTVGVLKNIERFLNETKVNLAISLHNPFPEERKTLVPSENINPIYKVINILKRYDFSGQRRLSFEYTMFEGWNDSDRHLSELSSLLGQLDCRVNLIRFHNDGNSPLKGTDDRRIKYFNTELNNRGIHTTTRTSRGEDILAACGMLANRK